MYPIDSQNAFTEYGIVYDPNLKPQNTRSYELGADISFFNNWYRLITLTLAKM